MNFLNERMLLFAPLPLLLVAALVCWVLGRRVPTRRLGIGAALTTGVAIIAMIVGNRMAALPLDIGGRGWIAAFGTSPNPVASATLTLRIDGLSLLFGVVLLAGGAVGLLYLAQSLGANLRGYGRLWSAVLLVLAGAWLGVMAGDLLLLVFGWGLAIGGTALARRVVGNREGQLSSALSLGAVSLLVLLIAVLGFALRPNDPTSGSFAFTDLDAAIGLRTWFPLILAITIAAGLPPFGRMVSDDEGTPPALHGVLIACGLPTLAMYSLVRVFGLTLGQWPTAWLLGLTVLGAVAVLGGAANALRAVRFGPLVGWQSVTQLGIVLVVLGRYNPARSLDDASNSTIILAVLALILATIWTTLASSLALGLIERRTGSDRIDEQPTLPTPLRIAGIVYALSAATAVGLPGLPGWWPRQWMLADATTSPVLLPVLTVGGGLLALSYLGPMVLFWRVGAERLGDEPEGNDNANLPVLALIAIPLLIFGCAPVVLGRMLLPALAAVQPVVNRTTIEANLALAWPLQLGLALGVIGLILLALRRSTTRRNPAWTGGEMLDYDVGTAHAPHASGYSLRAVAVLADLRPVFQSLSRGLEWTSERTAWALQIFSGRYYLTGVLIAALTLMLLLIQ